MHYTNVSLHKYIIWVLYENKTECDARVKILLCSEDIKQVKMLDLVCEKICTKISKYA